MEIYSGNYTVYAHVNKANGKIYVGITKLDPPKRWRNGLAYAENKYFFSAIQKYGWNEFDHEIIASNLTKEEACNFEQILIDKFNLTNREYGYNQIEGGSLPPNLKGECHPNFGNHLSDQIKQKISDSKKGIKHVPLSDETKRKISEGNKGKQKPHTEQWKQQMSVRNSGANNPHAKSVICVETGIVYPTAIDASRAIGKGDSAVKAAICTGRRAGGYYWEYI